MVKRWLSALQNKDRDVLTNLLSKSEHLRYIGTDENEFWSGQLVREGYADHAEEIPNFSLTHSVVEAFEFGNTGWALCISELRVEGMETLFSDRFSCNFVMEEGGWKIIQIHNSFPTPNREVIGVEHSAFEELIQSAKENFGHITGAETTTVMFTDIVNSTPIANAVGDRIWSSTIVRHIDSLTRAIEENGGSIVKTLGDGTMSTFLSARSALSAARVIQNMVKNSQLEPEFRIRVGVHTGDVIQTKGDFFGNVVNKAARIASAAGPGQILVSDATRAMVESSGDLRFGDPMPVILKGIEGSHSISILEWT